MHLREVAGRKTVMALGLLAVVGLAAGYGIATRNKPVEVPSTRPAAVRARASTPAGDLVVHVAGAVLRPGVYRLGAGERVADALQAAGGAIEGADLDSLNLAGKVRDGDKVLVGRRATSGQSGGAASQPRDAPGAGGKVNLNTATVGDLDALPGIGPALAAKIVAYREKQGPFRSVKDLAKVSGIGPAKYEGLADLVTV